MYNFCITTLVFQGPVSMTLYATGTDFQEALSRVVYLRECGGGGVKKFVTFHFMFHENHKPEFVSIAIEMDAIIYFCS